MTVELEEKIVLEPLSFEILKPTDEGTLSPKVEFNFEQLKKGIIGRVEKYKNLKYTDAQIKLAKTDKALLNSFKNLLEEERKRIKNCIMANYLNEFEPKVKELVKLIDEPINEINAQIVNYETEIKEKKENELKEFFNQNYDLDFIEISYEQIAKPEWKNLTFSTKKAKEEIKKILEQSKTDVNIILELKSNHEVSLINIYQNTLKLESVMRLKKEIEEKEASLNQAKQVEVSNKQDTCTFKPISDEDASKYMTMAVGSKTPAVKPQYYKKSFEVKATADDLRALDSF